MVVANGFANDIRDQPGYGAYRSWGPGEYTDPNGTKIGFGSYSDQEKIDFIDGIADNANQDPPVFS